MQLAKSASQLTPTEREAFKGLVRIKDGFIRDLNAAAFGSMMSCLKVHLEPKFKFPAGISIKGELSLVVNPQCFVALPDGVAEDGTYVPERDMQRGLIEHELGHLEQCLWRREENLRSQGIKVTRMRSNVAADIAVNQHIPEGRLPNITLGELKIEPQLAGMYELPEGKAYEWYFKNLPENAGQGQPEPDPDAEPGEEGGGGSSEKGDEDDDKQPGTSRTGEDDEKDDQQGGGGQGEEEQEEDNPHAGLTGKDIDEGDREDADAAMREMVERIKNDGTARPGTESANILERLDRNSMPKKATDWRAQLRRYLVHMGQAHQQWTWGRMNRRLGEPGAHYKTGVGKIVLICDVSSSMDSRALALVADQIDLLYKFLKVDVWVVQCDTRIHSAKPYDPVEVRAMHGRGGTYFCPAFDWVDQQKDVRFVIYFTDSQNADGAQMKARRRPRYPVLWALCGSAAYEGRQPWGREIVLKYPEEMGVSADGEGMDI